MRSTPLEEAIRAIEALVASHKARCVIVDEGCPDESSLMGTRDGYLNFALGLLRFVADADAGRCEHEDGHLWDDRFKDAMYQLPTGSAWLMGAYLFANHNQFMKELSRWVDPQLKYPLLNDPQFEESSDSAQ